MKKLMIVAAASALVVCAKPVLAERQPIKIGAIIAMSGPMAFLGDNQAKSLRLLEEYSNKNGGIAGHPFKLTIYDSEGVGSKAVQLMLRLAVQDNVDVIIGPSSAGEAVLAQPIANEQKVPTISFTAAESVVRPVTPYFFKTSSTDRIDARKLLGSLKARGIHKLGFIYSADAYGNGGARMISELAPDFGIDLVTQETFGPRDTDMTPQILKIRKSLAQAMLIWSVNPGPTIILKNASALQFDKPIFLCSGAGSDELIKQAGASSEGAFATGFRMLAPDTLKEDKSQEQAKWLTERYKTQYGIKPSPFAGFAFDAWLIIEAALRKIEGPVTRVALRDAMENATACGPTDCYSYSAQDHNGLGDGATTLILMRVKGLQWVPTDGGS